MGDGHTMRLASPLDVLGAVPYLLGYHPSDCSVLIGLRDRQLVLTALTELPAGRAAVDGLYGLIEGSDIDSAILVAYDSSERVLPMLPRIVTGLRWLGVDVLEVLRTDGERYWSYVCGDPRCCPPDGTPYDVRNSRVAAEATLAGLSALPDRATFDAQVESVTGAAREAMTRATDRAYRRLHDLLAGARDEPTLRAELVQAGNAALDAGLAAQRSGGTLDDDATAWLCVLAGWSEVRDLSWARLGETAKALATSRSLWLDVLRRAEPHLVPVPGTLFALAAWRRGEIVLARAAIERVLAQDPTHEMALFIESAIIRGDPPSVLRPLIAGDESTLDGRSRRVSRRRARRPRRRSSSRRAESPPT
jgi:hypothetical protein